MSFGFMPVFDDEADPKDVWAGKVSYCRECKHKDCEEIRQLRLAKRSICGKQFQKEEQYCGNKQEGYAHFGCMIEKEEKEHENNNNDNRPIQKAVGLDKEKEQMETAETDRKKTQERRED